MGLLVGRGVPDFEAETTGRAVTGSIPGVR